MKTSSLLTLLLGLVLGARAQTPPATPATQAEREAAARALLDQTYAEIGRTNTTNRTISAVPARVVSNTPPVVPVVPAPAAPAPATTTIAAPTLPAPPAAASNRPAPTAASQPTNVTTTAALTNAAAARAASTNRPARTFPTLPAPPSPAATTPVPVATPAPNALAPTAPPPGGVVGAAAPNPNTVPAVGGAAAKPPEEEVFPPGLIKFSEADLSQVLEIYQELTGRTVLRPASLPAAKITIKSQTQLTRTEAIQALDSILSMNQITMIPQGDKFIKAVPEAQSPKEANRTTDLPWELLPESGTIVTYVVQLTNAVAAEAAQVLAQFSKTANSILPIPSTGMLVIRDYAENVKRMMEIIQKIDVVAPQDFIDVVIPIKYALAGDIAQVLSSLTAGGGGSTTVGRSTANTGLSTGGAGGFGNRGGLGGAGGAGGFGNTGIPGQPGYNPNQAGGALGAGGAGGTGGRSSFANRLNQIVNRAASGAAGGDIFVLGQTKIIADERTNSLLIFASKGDLHTISNIIEKLDVVLAQVLIEAVVMEVSLNNNLDYGISYIQNKPTTIGDFIGAGAVRTIPFLNLASVTGAANSTTNNALGDGFSYAASFFGLDAAITAIAGDGRGKILQRPRIQTSHAVEANLFVGQSRPYPTGSGNSFGGGSYSQIQQLQIGVTLSVLPLINHDGLVVMDIRQKVESYDGDVVIQNVGAVPITSQKEANAKVAVKDRETVMLGGFISNQKNNAHGGVPFLKDIPVLGNLFRSTKNSEDRRELIVLIRPTVLPTPGDASIFAREERARMPLTKEAEQDIDESERKLLEDTNRRMEKRDKERDKAMKKKEKNDESTVNP